MLRLYCPIAREAWIVWMRFSRRRRGDGCPEVFMGDPMTQAIDRAPVDAWMPFFDRGRQASGRFTNDQQVVDNGIDHSADCLEVRKGDQLDIAANLLDRFLHVCNKQQPSTARHGSARQGWSRVGIR